MQRQLLWLTERFADSRMGRLARGKNGRDVLAVSFGELARNNLKWEGLHGHSG